SNATPPPAIYTLSLHDALPISSSSAKPKAPSASDATVNGAVAPSPGLLGNAASRRPARVPRSEGQPVDSAERHGRVPTARRCRRSEEHTSELQSRFDLVCRLLL